MYYFLKYIIKHSSDNLRRLGCWLSLTQPSFEVKSSRL